jgi:lipopolysaccharide biosynthesis protein
MGVRKIFDGYLGDFFRTFKYLKIIKKMQQTMEGIKITARELRQQAGLEDSIHVEPVKKPAGWREIEKAASSAEVMKKLKGAKKMEATDFVDDREKV